MADEDYHSDTLNPLDTFLDDPDEVFAIGLGILSRLEGTEVNKYWETLPKEYQERVKEIIISERPYALAGYYGVALARFFSKIKFHPVTPIYASDIHAFAYGVDQARTGTDEDRYIFDISPEGRTDILMSQEYYLLGQKVGRIIRWFL